MVSMPSAARVCSTVSQNEPVPHDLQGVAGSGEGLPRVSMARQKLGELVNEVYKHHVRVIVEKSGIPVVALVALSDLERWLQLEKQQVAEERMHRERKVRQPSIAERLIRRQEVAARTLRLREQANIAPLSTADLVHQVRQEAESSDDPGA
jgi:prevent-host-death family protein